MLRKHFYEPDLEAARILYGSVAAHQLTGQPVWPMLIAPPGSMKTELLKGLSNQKNVWVVDSVTTKTFLSGQIARKNSDSPPSLLHKIGDSGILLIPDFSTIITKRSEDRAQIFADLRRIFDGDLEKHHGTSESEDLRWEGRITTCVAATPEVDNYTAVEGALGDRFIRIRMKRADNRAAIFAQKQDPKVVRTQLCEAVDAVFASIPTKAEVDVPDKLAAQIADFGDVVAIARTPVKRDSYSKEIISGSADDAESATRLSQQLYQLARGLALLDGVGSVAAEHLIAVTRAGFDSIPPRRAEIIRSVVQGRPVAKSTSTMLYAINDLVHLGLVDEIGGALQLSSYSTQRLRYWISASESSAATAA
jgi:hypothetical protein